MKADKRINWNLYIAGTQYYNRDEVEPFFAEEYIDANDVIAHFLDLMNEMRCTFIKIG